MYLHERLQKIAENIAGNKANLAKSLGIAQGTMHAYFTEEGAKKIRISTLIKMCELYPQMSKAWLFWGEGEMLQAQVHRPLPHEAALTEKLMAAQEKIIALQEKNAELREELELLRGHIAGNFNLADTARL